MATLNLYDTIRGDTYNGHEFELHINDTPADLTGARIDMWFRQGSNIGSVKKKLSTTTGGIIITSPTEGKFQIKPFLAILLPDTYYHDIQITYASGKVKTYMSGTWKIIQDITL